jgi:hypothetical protein
MATVMEDQYDSIPHHHRVRWRFLLRRRPFCPDHPETVMVVRKTVRGISHCYCPLEGCHQKWKGRAQQRDD